MREDAPQLRHRPCWTRRTSRLARVRLARIGQRINQTGPRFTEARGHDSSEWPAAARPWRRSFLKHPTSAIELPRAGSGRRSSWLPSAALAPERPHAAQDGACSSRPHSSAHTLPLAELIGHGSHSHGAGRARSSSPPAAVERAAPAHTSAAMGLSAPARSAGGGTPHTGHDGARGSRSHVAEKRRSGGKRWSDRSPQEGGASARRATSTASPLPKRRRAGGRRTVRP